MGVSQDSIWHLIRSRVEEAWNEADWKSLERLGVDETSTRKGHKYGTAFLEINGRETVRGEGASKVARLLSFTPGKDKETFAEFEKELLRRGYRRFENFRAIAYWIAGGLKIDGHANTAH